MFRENSRSWLQFRRRHDIFAPVTEFTRGPQLLTAVNHQDVSHPSHSGPASTRPDVSSRRRFGSPQTPLQRGKTLSLRALWARTYYRGKKVIASRQFHSFLLVTSLWFFIPLLGIRSNVVTFVILLITRFLDDQRNTFD